MAYEVHEQHPGRGVNYVVQGPMREDKTRPLMMVSVIDLLTSEQRTPLAGHLRGGLSTLKQRHEDFDAGEVELGQIHGLTFARQSFTGIAHAASKLNVGGEQMHGLIYVAIDGQRLVSAVAMNIEPYHDETLPVMRSSIGTLHRVRGDK